VATGASQQLIEHTGKQLISVFSISHDGRTLLVTSNANDGYNNAALVDLATKKLRWITHTQWSAAGAAFTPDGGSVTVELEVRGAFVELELRAEGGLGNREQALPHLDAVRRLAPEASCEPSIETPPAGGARLSLSFLHSR